MLSFGISASSRPQPDRPTHRFCQPVSSSPPVALACSQRSSSRQRFRFFPGLPSRVPTRSVGRSLRGLLVCAFALHRTISYHHESRGQRHRRRPGVFTRSNMICLFLVLREPWLLLQPIRRSRVRRPLTRRRSRHLGLVLSRRLSSAQLYC
jgi:hypothetical protein